MKKIIYLSTVALFSVGTLMAQTGMAPKNVKQARSIDVSEPQTNVKTKPMSNYAKSGNAVWTDDFSNPDNWVFSNTSTPNPLDWSIETDNTISPVLALNPINLSSWENGFAFINGDPEGEGSIQNANLTTANPIDLSGFDNVSLVFEQVSRNFATTYTVRVSIDGGDTWIPFAVNEDLAVNTNTGNPGEYVLNISSVAGGQPAVLIQFNFLAEWGWFWAIDDVAIIQTPDNDMVIGATWLNNYFDYPAEDEDTEWVKRFSYWNQPQYVTSPFNFVGVVTNNGLLTQTGVRLKVTFEDPAGNEQEILSDPITVESGVTDTIRILESIPNSWVSPAAEGVYTAAFEVIQNEEDLLPENNIGTSRTTRISVDGSEGAIFQNDRGVLTNFPLDAQAQNTIHGNRYVFAEPTVNNVLITHVEFVLASFSNAPTVPGELLYINVRSGSVFQAESSQNVLTRYFGAEDIEYTILEEDLSTNAGLNWISIELPSPILIEPDLIYQGEVEIPAGEQAIAFIGLSNDQEDGSSVLLDIAAPGSGWSGYANTSTMIRFRTQSVTSVEKVTYDNGVKLVQNYPNPFQDFTTIQYQLDVPSNVRFDVFDISGKLVHSENLGIQQAMTANIIQFNASRLSAGVYTYSISTDTGIVTRKMVVE